MAAAPRRAPLYEDKVVDFLFGKAEITDREATREELEAAIESEDGFSTGTHVHDHDHAPKPKRAKKSAPADVEATADEVTPDAAAKPARGKKGGAASEAAEADAGLSDQPTTDPAPVKPKRATKPAAKGANAGVEIAPADEAATEPASKPKPRARKGAPLEAETQLLESSPVAAETAEGTQAADAPAKRAKGKGTTGVKA